MTTLGPIFDFNLHFCLEGQLVRAGLSLLGELGFLDRALERASEQGRQWGSVAQGSTGALRVPAMVSWPHYGPCR